MKISYLTATAEIYLDDTTHRWVALEHERPTGKTWPEERLDEARRWLHGHKQKDDGQERPG